MSLQKSVLFISIPLVLLLLYLPFDRPFFGSIHSFETGIDGFIPLITFFVIPYISYYFLLLFFFFYFGKWGGEKLLTSFSSALTSVILLAYLFYFFFQNSVERPDILNRSIFDTIYLFINRVVPPYNAFPSLHVAISLVVLVGFYQLKVRFFNFLMLWVVLIIISTVLTKQHYVMDLIGGIVLAIGVLYTMKLLPNRIKK